MSEKKKYQYSNIYQTSSHQQSERKSWSRLRLLAEKQAAMEMAVHVTGGHTQTC